LGELEGAGYLLPPSQGGLGRVFFNF